MPTSLFILMFLYEFQKSKASDRHLSSSATSASPPGRPAARLAPSLPPLWARAVSWAARAAAGGPGVVPKAATWTRPSGKCRKSHRMMWNKRRIAETKCWKCCHKNKISSSILSSILCCPSIFETWLSHMLRRGCVALTPGKAQDQRGGWAVQQFFDFWLPPVLWKTGAGPHLYLSPWNSSLDSIAK